MGRGIVGAIEEQTCIIVCCNPPAVPLPLPSGGLQHFGAESGDQCSRCKQVQEGDAPSASGGG